MAAELGANALVCHAGTDAEVRATLQQARERFGPLNGLINFARIDDLEYPGLEGMELISRFVSAGLVRTFGLISAVVAAMGDGSLDRSARGVIVNRTAETVVRLLPPLIITEAEASEALDRLDAALEAAAREKCTKN